MKFIISKLFKKSKKTMTLHQLIDYNLEAGRLVLVWEALP